MKLIVIAFTAVAAFTAHAFDLSGASLDDIKSTATAEAKVFKTLYGGPLNLHDALKAGQEFAEKDKLTGLDVYTFKAAFIDEVMKP